MAQIAGAHAEHVGTHPERSGLEADGEIIRSGASRFAVYAARRERRARCEMSDDGDDGRVIRKLLRDPDGDVPAAAVVHGAQRQRPSPNSAPGVDFLDRELRGMLHRYAAGL